MGGRASSPLPGAGAAPPVGRTSAALRRHTCAGSHRCRRHAARPRARCAPTPGAGLPSPPWSARAPAQVTSVPARDMFDVCLPRGPSRCITTEWPPGVGGQDGRCAQAPPSAGSRPPTSSAFHMSCLRGDGPSFLRWSGRRPPRRKASALALRGGRVPRIRSRPGLPQSPTPLDRPSPACVRRASASRSLPTRGTEAGGRGAPAVWL